jgi:hypothetical protein
MKQGGPSIVDIAIPIKPRPPAFAGILQGRQGWIAWGIVLAILLAGLTATQSMGEGTSRIEVASDPSGYDAWLNDHYVGRTPIAATVKPGPNVLVLARSAADSIFSAPAVDTLLDVMEGETLRVQIPLGRPVTILSRPFGVLVERDGVVVGRTPLELRIDAAKPVSLDLVTSRGRVGVPLDSLLATGLWTWRGAEAAFPPPEQEGPHLKKVGRYALPGFAALCIGSGALIERSADHAYDRYLRSGDLREMRRNYDSARRRDTWSTLLWTTGEVSLAASILSWLLPDHDRLREGGEGDR